MHTRRRIALLGSGILLCSTVSGCGDQLESQATQWATDRAVETQTDVAFALSQVANHHPSQVNLTTLTKQAVKDSANFLSAAPPADPQRVVFWVTAKSESGGFNDGRAEVIGCFAVDASWDSVALEGVACPSDLEIPQLAVVMDTHEPLESQEVGGRPCYGGEAPDDPDCGGG